MEVFKSRSEEIICDNERDDNGKDQCQRYLLDATTKLESQAMSAWFSVE